MPYGSSVPAGLQLLGQLLLLTALFFKAQNAKRQPCENSRKTNRGKARFQRRLQADLGGKCVALSSQENSLSPHHRRTFAEAYLHTFARNTPERLIGPSWSPQVLRACVRASQGSAWAAGSCLHSRACASFQKASFSAQAFAGRIKSFWEACYGLQGCVQAAIVGKG